MKTEEVGQSILETWTVDEVQDAYSKGEIVLIDVRTPQEFMFEHIPGALLLPMSFLECASLPGQSDKRIVFHCGSGVRSEKVARRCIEEGFARIAHMEGGFGAWKGANKPYMGTNMATGAPQMVK